MSSSEGAYPSSLFAQALCHSRALLTLRLVSFRVMMGFGVEEDIEVHAKDDSLANQRPNNVGVLKVSKLWIVEQILKIIKQGEGLLNDQGQVVTLLECVPLGVLVLLEEVGIVGGLVNSHRFLVVVGGASWPLVEV